MKYIIANWKSNKNLEEVNEWLDEFLNNDFLITLNDVTIIICPPFPFLKYISELTKTYQCIKVGAQDLSSYPEGAFTGETSAKAISGIADFAIIGHSERRKYQKESEEICLLKHKNALSFGINPIYCVSSNKQLMPEGCRYLAYEPIEAIGTGNPESIESVERFYHNQAVKPKEAFIYGGSVNKQNINEYLKHELINGVLVGNASLSSKEFSSLIMAYLQNK